MPEHLPPLREVQPSIHSPRSYSWLYGYIGILLLLAIFFIVFIRHTIKQNNKALVIKTSKRYCFLLNLYNDLSSYLQNNAALKEFYAYFNDVHSLRSLSVYGVFDFDKNLSQYLRTDYGNSLDSLLNGFKQLRNIIVKHLDAVGTVPPFMSKEELCGIEVVKSDMWFSFALYSNNEQSFCAQLDVDKLLSIDYKISYVSPAGRNHYRREQAYSFEQIIHFINEACETLHVSSMKRSFNRRTMELRASSNRKRGSISQNLRYKILYRDNFTCQKCGARGLGAKPVGGDAVLEVDHRIPFSLGGTDDIDNLWTLCINCNRGKGNMYID